MTEKEQKRTHCGDENGLRLDCGAGYTGVYVHQNSFTWMLKTYAFYYIVYFNKISKKCISRWAVVRDE